MNSIRLSPVPVGTRWPSGESIDLAVLPMTDADLEARTGLPLLRGNEDGQGGWVWAAIGGRLPCGSLVEFVWYAVMPKQVIVRVDKNADYSAALDEALQLIGMARDEVRVLC